MLKIVLIILGLIIVTLGVIFVFDARILTKKMFSFGDQNEASTGFKMIGFLISIAGAFIIYFNL